MKSKVAVFVCILIVCLFAFGSDAKNMPEKKAMGYIAVMDLKCDEGIKESQCGFLTEVVIEEFVKTGKYNVIDRANRDKILSEVGFQQSGCVEGSCTVEAGRILGVGKIVVGSIVKMGDTYAVSLQLINVESALVEKSTRRTCRNCKLDNLIGTVAETARKLMGEETPEAAPSSSGSPTRGSEMVFVPAGDFPMGCGEGSKITCEENEQPQHKVYLDAFYIDKYEATVSQYRACVLEGVCRESSRTRGPCLYDSPGVDNYPVNCVDWNQAETFCKWAGKRLPTEAEWEKAARGSDGRAYPWGNAEPSCDYAVYKNSKGTGCGTKFPRPVGDKPKGASPYGAMDMVGNVWEWTADFYGEEYYAESPVKNPKGPNAGLRSTRVARGGGWDSPVANVNVMKRRGRMPQWVNRSYGIRCAKSK